MRREQRRWRRLQCATAEASAWVTRRLVGALQREYGATEDEALELTAALRRYGVRRVERDCLGSKGRGYTPTGDPRLLFWRAAQHLISGYKATYLIQWDDRSSDRRDLVKVGKIEQYRIAARARQLGKDFGAVRVLVVAPAVLAPEKELHEWLDAHRAAPPMGSRGDGFTEWFYAHPRVLGVAVALREFLDGRRRRPPASRAA